MNALEARFQLWEIHDWRACDTCGLRGEELTEPAIISRTVSITAADEAVTITEVTAPPLARFLTPEHAMEDFADQLTTTVRYAEAIEVRTLGSHESMFVSGRPL